MPGEAQGPRRLGEVLSAGAAWLARRGVDQPRLVCEWLASSVLGLPRLRLHTVYARELTPPQLDAMRRGVTRVGAGEPVQYVLGEWDFRELTLRVDRRALVPRPETEQLVQLVLDAVELWQRPTPVIVDVGTGSGCIALSLAHERPGAVCVAIDASGEALALARENAAHCGLADRVRFIHGEGCASLPPCSVDAVVSNPPYIPASVVDTLPRHILEHEPRLALDGGPDGLNVLRNVAHDAAMVLRPQGWCFLELGNDQGPAVRDMLEAVGMGQVEIVSDLAGQPRFARARML